MMSFKIVLSFVFLVGFGAINLAVKDLEECRSIKNEGEATKDQWCWNCCGSLDMDGLVTTWYSDYTRPRSECLCKPRKPTAKDDNNNESKEEDLLYPEKRI